MDLKKIGFFGGCFNPPTNIHINLANKLITEGKLDTVFFVPVGDYYKKPELALAKHRFNMLKLACKDKPNLYVEDILLKCTKNMYASDAFEIINNKYNMDELYFIMGSDNFEKMPTWNNYNLIKDKYRFIVLDRNDENCINSTKVRNMIKNKLDVKKWLSQDVIDYIKANNLYV